MLDLDALVHAVEADQQNGHVGAVRKDDHELEGEAEAFVFARDRIGRRVGIHCNKRSQSWADGIEEGTDVINLFSQKNRRKSAFFYSKQSEIMQKFDHLIGF
jgi:hypothetical protein